MIAPLNEFGVYVDGFDWLTGPVRPRCRRRRSCENLKKKGVLYRGEHYTHRYPVCWRCGTDLVFRLVDEWFIAMDELRAADDGRHAPGQLGARASAWTASWTGSRTWTTG